MEAAAFTSVIVADRARQVPEAVKRAEALGLRRRRNMLHQSRQIQVLEARRAEALGQDLCHHILWSPRSLLLMEEKRAAQDLALYQPIKQSPPPCKLLLEAKVARQAEINEEFE
jgi:hypothetical protein